MNASPPPVFEPPSSSSIIPCTTTVPLTNADTTTYNSNNVLPLSIGIPLLVVIGISLLVSIVILVCLLCKICRETLLEREYIQRQQQLLRQYNHHTPDEEPLPVYKSRDSEQGFTTTVLPTLWDRRASALHECSGTTDLHNAPRESNVPASTRRDGNGLFVRSERSSSFLPMHGPNARLTRVFPPLEST
ncbi:hypothetical protein BJ741DRAFT_629062 [Chytriomyces cf. hyalinus JEL632]|nr:hypothetical protein BJ741DRAFT_629062 [Chytriomyces cf. hyalinus JEL632]